MPQKIRKFLALLLILPLAGCVTDGFVPAAWKPAPPMPVAQMTMPPVDPNNPPLYCTIGRGSALFGREWYDFGDTSFALMRGVPANVSVPRARGGATSTIQVLFDGSGQKLIFCPYVRTAPAGEKISCSSHYALEDDLKDGIKRTFDIPQAIRGAAITCAYSQEHLRSLDVEHNN